MLILKCGVEGEPYPLDTIPLEDAILEEAEKIAADAGADLLEGPEDEFRDLLAQQVAEDMTRALRHAGDTYTDPTGVRYRLVEQPD